MPNPGPGRLVLHVALAAILASALPLAARAEDLFYRSDEAGFLLEPIKAPGPGEKISGFWLELTRSGEVEIRLLREGAEESKRWERSRGPDPGTILEKYFEGGILAGEVLYGDKGQTLEESAFDLRDGSLLWKDGYRYEEGRLAEVTRRDASGSLLGRKGYRFDPKGRLVQLDLEGCFGDMSEGRVPGAVLPVSAWSSDPEGDLRIQFFNDRGSVSSERVLKGGKTLSIRRFTYGATGRLSLETLEELAEGLLTEKTYDESGRLTQSISRRGGEVLRKSVYVWNDSGLLEREERLLPLPREERRYSYDAEGELLREELRIDGALSLVVVFDGRDKRMEETWSEGEAVVRTYYEGGLKVLEEFLEGGVVKRTRRYR